MPVSWFVADDAVRFPDEQGWAGPATIVLSSDGNTLNRCPDNGCYQGARMFLSDVSRDLVAGRVKIKRSQRTRHVQQRRLKWDRCI
jgi:hypothetical protein